MTRLVAAISSLAVLAGALIIMGQAIPVTAAQSSTTMAEHPLVVSWLVYETNPPNGGPAVLSGVASFFADGNALLSGFGDQQYQGTWIVDSSHEATFTVVAPSAGGFGEIDQIRAAVEVATDGGPFRGTYSFDVLRADGSSTFNYNGPIEGRRVEAQAPNPYP
jgi:hypothetical protein